MRSVILLLTLGLASCAQAPERTGSGVLPTIVSLNPCSDAILAELAAPEQLLAISHYSHDPAASSMDIAAARAFPAVSGSVEEVLAFDPDLVVADAYLPVATRTALRDLGMRLVELPIATTVEESKQQVAMLANAARQPSRGKALNARIDAALARARARPLLGAQPGATLVWQAGGIVPGEDTLIADLLRRSGHAHSSAARGMKQADYLPLEQVLANPPALILAAGDTRANENRLLSHPALTALVETRREAFDSSLLWCGGPAIIRAAERLAEVRERPFETDLHSRSGPPQGKRRLQGTVRAEERPSEGEAASRSRLP